MVADQKTYFIDSIAIEAINDFLFILTSSEGFTNYLNRFRNSALHC